MLGEEELFCTPRSKKAMSTGWPTQNWYSQNNPFRSNKVGVGKCVEIGTDVGAGRAAIVAATDWLISDAGSRFGTQADRIINNGMINIFRICRLYNAQ